MNFEFNLGGRFWRMRWRIFTGVLVLAVVGGAYLFTRNTETATSPGAEIVFQLPWRHSGAFAGYYMADQNRYYANEGIGVRFREGGGPINPITAVLNGTAQIGIASGDHLLEARARGAPVRAIAVMHQLNPIVFAVLEESDIRHPRQFSGKTIHTSQTNLPILRALTKKFGVDRDQYRVVDIADRDLFFSQFYNGEIDVLTGFHFWTPLKLSADGKSAFYMYPDDYGIHFYRDSIFTTDDFVDRQPDILEGFLRATFRGWTHISENINQAGLLTRKYRPDADARHENEFLAAMLPLINTGESPIGAMRPEIWEQMSITLKELDMLPRSFDSGEVYTTRFVQRVTEAP